MANHCLRGQPLPKSGGGLARGTRDNLNLAIGRGDLDAVKRFLFDDGVDANDPVLIDGDGWTPLHRACAFGHVQIVDALLDSGADPGVTDRDNNTPMTRATIVGELDIVASLAAFNPRKSNTMYGGCSERTMATKYHHTDIVKLLDGDLSVLETEDE